VDFQLFEVPTKAISSAPCTPYVSSLFAQKDGTLLCGLMFSSPALFRVHLDSQFAPKNYENLAEEAGFDADVYGLIGGLRPSVSGDTAFCVLHQGMLPGFLRSIFGGELKKQSGNTLVDFLQKQEGGLGLNVRHSIVQIADSKIFTRRFKDPGMLWDVDHIGVNVFGMSSKSIWKEPYLNTEKREVLRKDLGFNRTIARDPAGTFWFADENNRLMRMSMSDIKPKRTPLKLPDDSGVFQYTVSHVDGWMYLVCEQSQTLMRVRMNPISHEEESQKVMKFDSGRISGICAVDDPRVSKLFLSLDTASGVEFYSSQLITPEDPEIMPPAPLLKKVSVCTEVKSVNSLTVSFPPIVNEELQEGGEIAPELHKVELWKKHPLPVLWAGEGHMGWSANEANNKTRILKISGL